MVLMIMVPNWHKLNDTGFNIYGIDHHDINHQGFNNKSVIVDNDILVIIIRITIHVQDYDMNYLNEDTPPAPGMVKTIGANGKVEWKR